MFTVTDDDGDVGTDTMEIIVKTPVEALHDLIEILKDMALPSGTVNSLTAKLSQAIDCLERGQTATTLNKLQAFINEVEGLTGKKLDQESAEDLIAYTQRVIDFCIQ